MATQETQAIPSVTPPKKTKKPVNKRKIRKIIIWVVILAVIAAVAIFLYGRSHSGETETTINTARVTRGDVEVSISGSGTIEANDQYEVTSLVKGEIISAPFEEGDIVEKGDLLYQIDTKDVENSIEQSKLSLQRSQLSYEQTLDSISKLGVTAPIDGTITTLYVKEGDNVSAGGTVAEITDSSTMILTVPFIAAEADLINVGEAAQVTLQSTSYVLSGTVKNIASGESVSDLGVATRSVEIAVVNPGGIKQGDQATALVGTIACNDVGTFDYNDVQTATAEVAGKIESLPYVEGDVVKAGVQLATMSSDSLENSEKTGALSIQESQLSLQNQYDQLEDYNITAPISGTIISKTSKAGDTLDNTNSQTVMATIADLSKIIFKMNVDELDIAKMQVGQEVTITADALEDQVFTGYIDYISIIGTSSNGVTSYPVTIVVNNPDGLIPGMNVDAKVIVERKENVLRVPVSALNRGNTVYVKSDDASAQESSPEPSADGTAQTPNAAARSDVPNGFKAVQVTTGLNDSDFIEIESGLNEGDEVYIPNVVKTASMEGFPMGGPGGGGGAPGGGGGAPGGGGGAPGGGGPGGGM